MNLRPVSLDAYLSEPTRVERHLTSLLKGRTKPVILDIGACEGEDSIRYARLFPRAQVYSFEPLPANQHLIRENLAKYQVRNAELVPLALSNRSGAATFHVSSGRPEKTHMGADWNYGNKSSSLLPPASDVPMHGWITFEEKIEVACGTLDEFCAQRRIRWIDFIHMDVQGGEGAVLEGAEHALRKTLSIWLEVANAELYRGQKLRPEIQTFLGSRGFALALAQGEGVEGDQFYVNLRLWRGLLYWAALNAKRALRR